MGAPRASRSHPTPGIQTAVPSGADDGLLSVTTPGGTATSPDQLHGAEPANNHEFTPASGPAGPASRSPAPSFNGATAVTFNGSAASLHGDIRHGDSATVPAGATTGPLSVTTPGGTATSTASFTVLSPPTISGFTPTSGPVGRPVVTINGTNLSQATAVSSTVRPRTLP